MNKIILDLCGGTGSWSRPYKEAGYDVRLITLPDHDVLSYEPPENVYGILAAPPCTMFSIARQNAKTPRDFKKGMEVVEACLKIVWKCRQEGSLKFWALENPRGYLRQFLGKPPFTFKHWMFGDFQHDKTTDIWGFFEAPKVIVKEKFFQKHSALDEAWAKPRVPEWAKDMKLDRAAIRAITPQNFAKSFFRANQ